MENEDLKVKGNRILGFVIVCGAQIISKWYLEQNWNECGLILPPIVSLFILVVWNC